MPVPRSAFVGGVTASFFNGTTFSGPVLATRRYAELDHNWNWVAPAAGVDPKDFSVRWSALLKVPAAGDYQFELQRRRCDATADIERYTIRIEGAGAVKVEAPCSARDAGDSPAVTVHFDSTRPRRLTVEYAHRSRDFAPAITLVWRAPAQAMLDQAVAAARRSDVVLAFVGLNAWLEGEEMPVQIPGFAGGDRTDIAVPAPQRALLRALEATGKPVDHRPAKRLGRRRSAQKAQRRARSCRPGTAASRVAMRSPTSSPAPTTRVAACRSPSIAGTTSSPPFSDYAMTGRTYRYFTGSPEYPFGHGLSYTNFAFSALSIRSPHLAAGTAQQVSIRVRNAGKLAGDEVVQLYVAPERRDAPLRSLKGFERVHLAPGEERVVQFQLGPRDLAFADAKGVMRIVPGEYRIWVGGGQPGTGAPGAAAAFRMTGELALQP